MKNNNFLIIAGLAVLYFITRKSTPTPPPVTPLPPPPQTPVPPVVTPTPVVFTPVITNTGNILNPTITAPVIKDPLSPFAVKIIGYNAKLYEDYYQPVYAGKSIPFGSVVNGYTSKFGVPWVKINYDDRIYLIGTDYEIIK
jgi:hypothetical protein